MSIESAAEQSQRTATEHGRRSFRDIEGVEVRLQGGEGRPGSRLTGSHALPSQSAMTEWIVRDLLCSALG